MTPLRLGQLRLFPFSRALLSCAEQCPALHRSCACSQLLEAAEALSWRAATSYRYYHTNTDRNCCGFPPNPAQTSTTPIWTAAFVLKIIMKNKFIAKSTSGRDHCAENWTHLNGLSKFVGDGMCKVRTWFFCVLKLVTTSQISNFWKSICVLWWLPWD